MIEPDRIGHVVLKVRDLARSKKFYSEVLGLTVMGEVPEMRMVFFASRARDHHELAIMEVGRGAETPAPNSVGMLHVAFRLSSEQDLKTAYHELKQRGIPILGTVNHGISKSIYFADPDGNQIELYCDNPKETYAHMANPYAGRTPLDLG